MILRRREAIRRDGDVVEDRLEAFPENTPISIPCVIAGATTTKTTPPMTRFRESAVSPSDS
jgi:hypothetical protein